MGKCAQIIIGPAGVGKSTYCNLIQKHCESNERDVHIINLDPAINDNSEVVYSFNIQELISVKDVIKQFKYGPNGGLVFCMEYMVQNMDWLREKLDDYDDDYLLFDCPGQIELYTHYNTFDKFIKELQRIGYKVCVVYLLDACFLTQSISKFISGNLACLSTMVNFETVPNVNILSKCDLVKKEIIDTFLDEYDIDDLNTLANKEYNSKNEKFMKLNNAICDLLKNFNLVSFLPLNIKEEDSISNCLAHIDMILQYDEDLEVKMKKNFNNLTNNQ